MINISSKENIKTIIYTQVYKYMIYRLFKSMYN